MSPRSQTESRGKALDLWIAPSGAGEPLVCLATSFTFDAGFFETECLGRFLQMDTHPSESESVAYLIEREEKLAAARVCALVDRRHAREKESLRWDVLGVLVPSAIQHAKVSMLVWGNHVRVIIGSGNLTEPGYRRNLEVFGTIELSKQEGGDRAAVEQVIDFLEVMVGLAVGDDTADTPKMRVRQAIATIRRRIARWPNMPAKNVSPVFGRPGQGVLPRVVSEWPDSGPPRTASVVSPFFDSPGRDRDTIRALVAAMAKRGLREVFFSVRAEDLPDGRLRVFAPLAMVQEARSTCDVHVHTVNRLQDDEIRDLHAKVLRLENDSWSVWVLGSSNFTAAGLGINARFSNLEANLFYRLRSSDEAFRRLDSVWPEVSEEELDLESTGLVWDPEPEEMEGGADEVPLPACFREAIFLAGDNPRLRITLAENLPDSWNVRVPNGADLLGSAMENGPGTYESKWIERAPPFVLEVSWKHGSGIAVATWPVNVSNPASLPPPEELTGLSLEELLAILSSTRPIHDAVSHVLQKRRLTAAAIDIELDPLTRLDSQATLLRRTKRVAIALDRLRERLERPALSKDAFEWRLRGPIGPITLADAFIKEATLPGEAKFYLAELALALSRVRPSYPAAGGLSVSIITELITGVVSELETESRALVSSSDTRLLDGYAKEAFAEARGE